MQQEDTPPRGSHVDGTAAEPEVRERAGLPPLLEQRVEPAPLPHQEDIGVKARALAEHIPESPASTRELSHGEKFKLEKGQSVTVKIPETLNLRSKKPELSLDCSGTPVRLRIEDSDYIRRQEHDGDRQAWARMAEEVAGTVVLEAFGHEIAIESLPARPNYVPSQMPNGVDEIERQLSGLLGEEDRDKLRGIISEAEKEAEARRASAVVEAEELARKDSSPVFLVVGRGPLEGGGVGLVVNILTERINRLPLQITPDHTHARAPQVSPIPGNLIGFKPTEDKVKGLDSLSRSHMVICIDDGKITLWDGDGNGKPSSYGTDVTYSAS